MALHYKFAWLMHEDIEVQAMSMYKCKHQHQCHRSIELMFSDAYADLQV